MKTETQKIFEEIDACSDTELEEYRLEKKKDIKRMADMYKAELPAYVYEALLRFEIKPY